MPHINYDKNFLFVHIPKCAGNSIKKVLGLNNHDHTSISYEHSIDKNLFKFAFVRNPWDRFVSAYEYLRGGSMPGYDKNYCSVVNNYPSFEKFLLSKIWIDWIHFLPQFEYISVNNNVCMDFIGKVENIHTDFNYICKKINIPNQDLPHINVSKRKKYIRYFKDDLQQIIAEHYATDIKYFEYTFGTLI